MPLYRSSSEWEMEGEGEVGRTREQGASCLLQVNAFWGDS
jgi:hypothetical protein